MCKGHISILRRSLMDWVKINLIQVLEELPELALVLWFV